MTAGPDRPLVIDLGHRAAVADPPDVGVPAAGFADSPARRLVMPADGLGGDHALLAADTGGDAVTHDGAPVVDLGQPLGDALARVADGAGRAGVFVSPDRMRRAEAAAVGWQVAPHVAAAGDPAAPVFLRITGAVDGRRLTAFVPYLVDHLGESRVELIGTGDARTVVAAVAQRLEVQVLAGDPLTDDLVLVHLDGLDRHTLDVIGAHRLLYHRSTPSGTGVALLALGPDESVHDVDIHGAHGHLIALFPRPELLDPRPPPGAALAGVEKIPPRLLALVPDLEIDWRELLACWCVADATAFQHDVDRYSGAAPLDAAGPIVSRHVRHPDNDRAVRALLADLRGIGYCAWTHAFSHEGRTLRNVLAELPGRGRLRLLPEIELELRELLLSTQQPDAGWRDRVLRLVGSDDGDTARWAVLDPVGLHRQMIDDLRLKPWWPWWCRRPAAGWGAQLVVVGCHLDSTAGSDGGFDPVADPAPGADDDASGIAAVLHAARRLWAHRGTLTHTVRFAFFNAEEVGLVGSAVYASLLKSSGAPVKAAVCADMIGYNSDADRRFEIHAGHTNAAVRDASVPIALRVADAAASQGGLGMAQVHQGTAWPPSGNADRLLYDGAINRSDHASFHAQGYPAVVVSEDFFLNLPSEPTTDANPNYHRAADVTVDAGYGARLACAISEAARQLAK